MEKEEGTKRGEINCIDFPSALGIKHWFFFAFHDMICDPKFNGVTLNSQILISI